MSQEGVTYTELKFNKSKKLADKRHPAHKKKEFPWHINSVILGILSFLLLLATSALVYTLFWRTCKNENLTCAEQNATFSPEIKYHHSASPSYTDVFLPAENLLSVTADKKNPSDISQGECSYCFKNCYYISNEEETWEESKKSCEVHGSRLLKIDDKEEQKFIQSKIQYNFWIGLKNERMRGWLWVDDSAVSSQLKFQPPIPIGESFCGFIKPTHISSVPCDRQHRYICEKLSYLDN